MLNLKVLPYVPQNDSVSEFSRWKQSRKKIISNFGPLLLNLNENELLDLFNFWENAANSNIQSEQPSSILIGYLHLAVLFYYQRSISQLNKMIQRINILVEHPNRCICKVSSHLLFYISFYSGENINYLHVFLTTSSIMITPTSPNVFRSLVILDEAFYLAPALVKSFIRTYYDTIVGLCFVDDFDLQDIALKVFFNYVSQSDTDWKNNLFVICYSHLKPHHSCANRGALYIAKILAKLHMTNEQITSLILMITNFLKLQDEMVLQLCFEVVFMIFDHNKAPISPSLMKNLFASMINCLRKNAEKFDHLFYLFVNIVKMTPSEMFDNDIILKYINFIFCSNNFDNCLGYQLLRILVKRDRQIIISFDIPFHASLCADYRAILKMRPQLIKDNQKQLQQIFENGFKPSPHIVKEESLILSLKVARVCGSLIWGNKDILIQKIYPLHKSSSVNVRLEVIKLLGKLEQQFELLVISALFDTSQAVRFASIKSFIKNNIMKNLNNQNYLELLPNVLNDQSIEVALEFIDLLDKIYELNPILFEPSIFAFSKKLMAGYLRSFSAKEASMASLFFPKFSKLILKVDADLAKSFASFILFILARGKWKSNPPILNDVLICNPILLPFENNHENNLKTRVTKLVNLSFVDKCDINCMISLEILKEEVDYSQVIPLFKDFLLKKRKFKVLTVSLSTLKSFIPYLTLPIDTELIEILFDILNHASFPDITTCILQIFGMAGVVKLPASIPHASILYNHTIIMENSSKFIHEELFKALCNLVPTQLPSFYSSARYAIIYYPNLATKYLGKLIPEFINMMKTLNKKKTLVEYLIQITYVLQNFMVPYLDLLQPILVENLDDISTVKLCKVLSFSLKNNFIPYSSVLFHRAISYLTYMVSYFNNDINFNNPSNTNLLKPSPLPNSIQSSRSATNLALASFSNQSTFPYGIPNSVSNSNLLLSLNQDNEKFNYVPNENNFSLVKELFKFLAFSTIFQNQPVDEFLRICEFLIVLNKNSHPHNIKEVKANKHHIRHNEKLIDGNICHIFNDMNKYMHKQFYSETINISDMYYKIVIKELIRVLQNNENARLATSWYLRIFLLLYQNNTPFIQTISLNLMHSIIAFGDITTNLVAKVLSSLKIQITFDDFIKNKNLLYHVPASVRNKITDILGQVQPTVENDYNDISSKFIQSQTNSSHHPIFNNIFPPSDNNIDKWIQEFTQIVVSNSPSLGIRKCQELAIQSEQFQNDILPSAFLSCWEVEDIDATQKNRFIQVFENIIANFQPLPEILWRMIDVLDICHVNFDLSLSNLAQASIFPAQALYYCKCEYTRLMNQYHKIGNNSDGKCSKCVENLLNQLLNLGQIVSARGVLACSSKYINNIEQWTEELGNWNTALKFYQNNNFVGTVKCLGNLEEWKEIIELEPKFESLSMGDKKLCAVWFSLAFFHTGNLDKAESYIQYFSSKPCYQQFYLKCFVKIIHEDFEGAKSMINEAFQSISNDNSMFDGSNVRFAEEKLRFSQHLIELGEIISTKLNLKKNQDLDIANAIPKIWDKRQPLRERFTDCRELVEIRSLLLPKDLRLKLAIKMSSTLRKGRQWNGLKGAFFYMTNIGRTPKVFFEAVKMLWCKFKKSAIESLNIFVQAHSGSDANHIRSLLDSAQKITIENLLFEDDLKGRNLDDPSLLNEICQKIILYSKSNHISEKFLAKAKRILATWKLEEEVQDLHTLFEHCKTLQDCAKIQNNKDLETLLSLALLDLRIIDQINVEINHSSCQLNSNIQSVTIYAQEAVNNFLKIIKDSNDQNLSAILLLLNVLSRYGSDEMIKDENADILYNLPRNLVIFSLPQLTNLLSHSCTKLRQIISQIILKLGCERFQKIFFLLKMGIQSESPLKSLACTEIYEKLQQKFPTLAEELEIFAQDMQYAAKSQFEKWKYGIEFAKNSYDRHDNQKVISIFKNLLNELETPHCDLDRSFRSYINPMLNDFRQQLDNFISTQNGDKLIALALFLYPKISKKIKQLSVISFSSVAPHLSMKHDMQITVPGTKGLVKIASFESTLKILEKSFYPRLLTIIGDDGINHHFLLKGTDIRIDYRIMQFLLLLNSFLSKNRITSSLSVTQYSIIPLTKSAGLISWVDNSDSLEYIIKKFSENRIKEKEIIKSSFKPCTRQMNSFQLYEIFDTIAKQTEADELDQYIWLTASTSSIWLKNNNNFACSSALMSIAGYIIGLGNRCPGNILMHSVNGKISEYDFQDSFEVLMHRVNHPEKVPFRLTRMISNALDGSNPYGLFKRTCEDVLSVLKLSKQTVIAQFELFTMDSTISKNSKFSNAKIVERIKEKLEGKDIFVLRKETKTVEEQVQALIQVASNPELYATQSYVWRSYW